MTVQPRCFAPRRAVIAKVKVSRPKVRTGKEAKSEASLTSTYLLV